MINRYTDLIHQTFDFPQESFEMVDGYLRFNDINLIELVRKYGTPLKLTYVPKIGQQVEKARKYFKKAIKHSDYRGKYYYCYCTKSCHFSHVLDEVLAHGAHLETSSSFDIDLVWKLYSRGKIDEKTIIINNGFKTEEYTRKISDLINKGFKNIIPVLDNKSEIFYYDQFVDTDEYNVGIRVATEEEPNFEFYTSRLGIRNADVLPFYRSVLSQNKRARLKMLHFFVDTGIKDSIYYWGELKKGITLYCELKKICPTLTALNIGGGMPIPNTLGFEYDYQYMISEIVQLIKDSCKEYGIEEPDIYTEFGKYTVGESGAVILSVVNAKKQNDSEIWYMVDNSLMNTIPDSWGIGERFILLPINKWNNGFRRVNIGGLSCDNSDYYNAEVHENQVYLPVNEDDSDEPLYIGFFHTGAYQDALSGYGGIKHCLIPSPKHIIVDVDDNGKLTDRVLFPEQTAESMLSILGY